jgi:F0F1-type ATP synthase assembly protein I
MIFVFGLVIIGLIAAVLLIRNSEQEIKTKKEDIYLDILFLFLVPSII